MAQAFDASIDILAEHLPTGMAPSEAITRVRRAVEAMPGARWVSVAWCGNVPPGLPALRVYDPGCNLPRLDGHGVGLAAVVGAVMKASLGR